MIKTYTIEQGQKPSKEQIEEVLEASKKPVSFDDDCEELSPELIKAFKSSAARRNRIKQA